MTAFGPALIEAARDYRYLLDRGYPEPSSLALVGNRHRLDAEERLMLFRGVASRADSERRRRRAASPEAGDLVLLDAYNVVFTIVHYYIGKPCFLSSDGCLRDVGANYGRVAHEELLLRVFSELAAFLGPRSLSIEAFFDAPVSRSGEHAGALREAFSVARIPADVRAEASADGAIVARIDSLLGTRPGAGSAAGEAGKAGAGSLLLVASSDSVLVDRAPLAWDLAREFLEARHGALFPDFGAVLDEEPRESEA
ncbi:MAG TPA: DUF434 domain-containing protein [Rectinemataceae bacterium]|nr:DUF434 domain-containing protein [Rectinemataceae bacterium]